jgi:ABC-2 type transport system ATP-binding protein
VLDEPVNGLDPAGIRDVRDLLRTLAAEGRTVFLSSHLLSEVQHTCDRVAIVAKGRTILAGTVDEVMASQRTAGLVVRLADTAAGLDVLTGAGFRVHAVDGSLQVDAPASEAERVTKTLADRQLYLTELRPVEVDLETVFLELTAGTGTI